MKEFIKLKDILERIPVSRSQLYAMISEGKFPRQIKLGGSGAFWIEEETEAWIEAHMASAGRTYRSSNSSAL